MSKIENVDYKPFEWFNKYSEEFMRRDESYLRKDETIEGRAMEISKRAFSDIYPNEEYEKLFYEYYSRGFISLSTPVMANFGRPGTLSIACFSSMIEDTMDSILYTAAEVGMMSKYGGGTSAYLGNIRPRGSKISKGGTADGPVHFCKLYETVIDVTKQGATRRGSMAVTLPIEHPDIEEFLTIRNESSEIQDLFPGVSVTDKWLQEMVDGDANKRAIWAKVIQSRQRVGTPYIFFHDNVNNNAPDIYKKTGATIHNSQLCQEILLPTNSNESFVCCLASLNAEKYDEWKDTKVVEVLTAFLDCVLTDFENTASTIPYLNRAVNFTKRHRAIGIGVLGYCSYLQKNMIPFESLEAKLFNVELFSTLKKRAAEESIRLGQELGNAPIFDEVEGVEKRRNTCLIAVAPTSSSSYILGQVSQGIEPYRSNYYTRDMAKNRQAFKNPYLKKLLEEKGQDTEEIWESIGSKFGSVQHLEFLTEHEKNVFKTFVEISQREIIDQAAQRQKFIDQTQSLNLMIHPSTSAKENNQILLYAWKKGIRTLYYHHSVSAVQEYSNNTMETCSSCEA